MKEKLKKLLCRLRNFLPSALPRGSKDFDAFTESIISTYSLPDLASYKLAVATMIMHLAPDCSWKSKRYFAVAIRKAMANEVAFSKIQEFKELEKKKAEKTPEGESLIEQPGRTGSEGS